MSSPVSISLLLLSDCGSSCERGYPLPSSARSFQGRIIFSKTTHPGASDPQPGTDLDPDPDEIIVLVECRRHPRGSDHLLDLINLVIGRIPMDHSQILWVFDWPVVEDMFVFYVIMKGFWKE